MPIPDYQTLMLPLLRFYSDGEIHSFKEAESSLAREFKLTPAELSQLIPSGRQSLFYNRAAWARTYISKAGLLNTAKRGYFSITPVGPKVLAAKPDRIDARFLRQFPSFMEFKENTHDKDSLSGSVLSIAETKESPEEQIESAHAQLKRALAAELISRIRLAAPIFFERLVVELLLKMGYGGSRQDAGRAIGRSGDGGIDGIINEDRLGLDSIYLQAKRWEHPVGRPEIQKFAGALAEHRAKKGVFITTSSFTKEALASATKHDARIVLIDGEKLATLMIDHGLGVTLEASYEIKRIDSDYFAEE
jgi:restriction system protein